MRINKIVSIAIIIVVTLVFTFLFVLPTYTTLGETQNTLAQKQAEYDSKSVYYANISDLIKKIESKKDALVTIDSALPSDSYLSSSMYFFQKKATENNIIVKSTTLSQVSSDPKKSAVKDITFNVHLTGEYESFKNFLSALDKSARLFEVDSLSFSTSAITVDPKDPKIKTIVYDFDMQVLVHAY